RPRRAGRLPRLAPVLGRARAGHRPRRVGAHPSRTSRPVPGRRQRGGLRPPGHAPGAHHDLRRHRRHRRRRQRPRGRDRRLGRAAAEGPERLRPQLRRAHGRRCRPCPRRRARDADLSQREAQRREQMPQDILGQSPLTVLVLVPALVAALVWLVPPLRRLARPIGLATSLVVLAGAVALAAGFDLGAASETQYLQTNGWIPAFGASYAVGVNGLGLTMILLATLLVPLVIVAGWKEVTLPAGVADDESAAAKALAYRQAGWVALVLVLEALMIAVFAARDVFLFYV